ncbi:MAG: helix-turn-helix domain-containing protein [Anaeromyxobacter sp.]
MAPSSSHLLTSARAAQLLGVTPATVKRWADAGLLACVRTSGGHRRFEPDDVARFLAGRRAAEPAAAEPWADRILGAADVPALVRLLLEERARLGAWWLVAGVLGEAVRAIGERWVAGRLTVADEHAASDRLLRALARCGEELPPRPGAPRVLLASADGDDHTLGLALAELVLREWGWPTVWAGRAASADELVRAIATRRAEVVALSASLASRPGALAEELERVVPALRAAGMPLLAGGDGPWPEPLPWGVRIQDFGALRTFLHAEDARRGASARPVVRHGES